MRIKMLLVFDFDPETGEYTPVSREIVEDKAVTAEKKQKTSRKKRCYF